MMQCYALLGLIILIAACSPPPTPTPTPTLTPTPTPVPEDETITLDVIAEDSDITFSVAFMGRDITGEIGIKEGTITLIENSTRTRIIVEIYLDMASLHTDMNVLDGLLKKLFQIEEYPTAFFYGDAADAIQGRYPRGETVELTLPSSLTLVTETVRKNVQTSARLEDRHMAVDAELSILFEDIGASPPPLMGEGISIGMTLNTH